MTQWSHELHNLFSISSRVLSTIAHLFQPSLVRHRARWFSATIIKLEDGEVGRTAFHSSSVSSVRRRVGVAAEGRLLHRTLPFSVSTRLNQWRTLPCSPAAGRAIPERLERASTLSRPRRNSNTWSRRAMGKSHQDEGASGRVKCCDQFIVLLIQRDYKWLQVTWSNLY